MHYIEMVTWLVGLPCYHLSNESNTLNTNIAVNNVKYINVNYSKYDCASFSTYVKGNLSWFVELKQYTVCVYFKWMFWTAFFKSIPIATSWYACFKLFIRRNANLPLYTFVFRHVASPWIFHLWSWRRTRRATYETSNYERWMKKCC